MRFINNLIVALKLGLAIFILEVAAVIIIGYIECKIYGLKYDFHLALVVGARGGLHVGVVIAVAIFIISIFHPRSRPPN